MWLLKGGCVIMPRKPVIFAVVPVLEALESRRLLAAQMPFSGVPAAIPGMIEAEDFDTGGEGVAYHDSTPGNQGGGSRSNTDVDVQPGGSGGQNVGYIRGGEFLKYTIDVADAGTY